MKASEARQLQEFNKSKEEIGKYIARGGVVHFRGSVTGHVLCGSEVGASVRKWKNANCIACFRVRKGARAAIDGAKRA